MSKGFTPENLDRAKLMLDRMGTNKDRNVKHSDLFDAAIVSAIYENNEGSQLAMIGTTKSLSFLMAQTLAEMCSKEKDPYMDLVERIMMISSLTKDILEARENGKCISVEEQQYGHPGKYRG